MVIVNLFFAVLSLWWLKDSTLWSLSWWIDGFAFAVNIAAVLLFL